MRIPGVPVAMAHPAHLGEYVADRAAQRVYLVIDDGRVRAAVIAIDGHGLHARAGGLEIRPVRSLAELHDSRLDWSGCEYVSRGLGVQALTGRELWLARAARALGGT